MIINDNEVEEKAMKFLTKAAKYETKCRNGKRASFIMICKGIWYVKFVHLDNSESSFSQSLHNRISLKSITNMMCEFYSQ